MVMLPKSRTEDMLKVGLIDDMTANPYVVYDELILPGQPNQGMRSCFHLQHRHLLIPKRHMANRTVPSWCSREARPSTMLV
jgi:hypothetical protein